MEKSLQTLMKRHLLTVLDVQLGFGRKDGLTRMASIGSQYQPAILIVRNTSSRSVRVAAFGAAGIFRTC